MSASMHTNASGSDKAFFLGFNVFRTMYMYLHMYGWTRLSLVDNYSTMHMYNVHVCTCVYKCMYNT